MDKKNQLKDNLFMIKNRLYPNLEVSGEMGRKDEKWKKKKLLL
jgi:hypothetical protein